MSAQLDIFCGPLGPLYLRPGFLFRRAHQIAQGIFVEECADLKLTPPQSSVLIAVGQYPGISQAEIARLIGFDRATVGQVVRGLATRNLVRRTGSTKDKRNRATELTPRGKRVLLQASPAMARISQRLLSPLNPEQRKLLIDLLSCVVDELNSASRSPLKPFDSPTLSRSTVVADTNRRHASPSNRRRGKARVG